METNQLSLNFDKRSLSGNTIKLLAMTAMLLEHTSVFLPSDTVLFWCMRFFGKAAAPVFFYFVVEGYHYTRNKNRYTLNLAMFTVVSYVPFILCFDGALNVNTFLNFSVIYNLLIGLLVIRTRHEVENFALRWFFICILFLLSCFGDWTWIAPLTILIFDLFYGNRKNQLYAYALLTVLRTDLIVKVLSPVLFFSRFKTFDFSEWHTIGYDLGALIPILFFLLYRGKKGGGGNIAKWGFYMFYPAHLMVIAVIKMYV
ncbi:MAG: hypothetical protein K0Q48_1891 [Bacillota bacterium]|nr:hypothetical protein [Bacillota bacterium]